MNDDPAGNPHATRTGSPGEAAPPPADAQRAWRPAPLWISIALSIALVCGVLAFAFLARPTDALAAALVEHLGAERDSWTQQRPVPQSALEFVLRRSGIRLRGAAAASGEIVYAQSCFLRGRYVPHLVLRTPRGAVGVLILRGEHVPRLTLFARDGFSGVLLPVDRNVDGDEASADEAVARFGDAALSLAIVGERELRADPLAIMRQLAPELDGAPRLR